MGSVWIAEHLALRTEVVVKFMSDDLAADPSALARFSREAAAAAQAKGPPGMGEVTSTGDTVGTPQYMSPEQLQGEKDIDLRADLWSVGVVAFRCLTGATPFEGDSVASVALKVVLSRLPLPTAIRPD